MEGCLDPLAKKVRPRSVGDALAQRARRRRDVHHRTDPREVGRPEKDAAGRAPQYEEAKRRGRAVGIACGVKNSGIGNGVKEWGRARLVVENDGTISIYNGFSEMGQGLSTILVQFAVEVTGLPASVFRPKVDTRFALGCGQTTGSRATLLAGRAVVEAAKKLARGSRSWRRGKCPRPNPLVAAREYAGERHRRRRRHECGRHRMSRKIKTHTAFGFATQLCILDEPGRVERIVAAHDVGRAINPAFCEGQIEGAVPHGPRICADRGVEVRRRDAGDEQDDGARRAARDRYAAGRRDPHRGSGARGAVRRERARRDRAGADRGGRCRRARSVRWRKAHDVADEGIRRPRVR